MDTCRRKRTESNSGNSDSDFSDGWNIVDHMDVNNPDVPSSDGESVEVIDSESVCCDEVEECELADSLNNQLLPKAESMVVPADERELPAPTNRHHDETFHSSFCWFLFFTVSALLLSDVALMVAESVLDWNAGVTKYVNQPSFLTDLPETTSKPPKQDKVPSKIPWADKEEVTVDSVEIGGEELAEEFVKSTEKRFDSNIKEYNSFYENHQKLSLKIDNHDIGKYFSDLSKVTISNEAQSKFSQTLLILDALHIGLNDLETVVTESSELHQVLKSQKETLINVIAEVQSGVSRSVEKMATNVLDKVQRLERNFEIQWCKLEKSGHKDELKGLFYDCQENEENYSKYEKRNQLKETSIKNNKFVKDSYQYQADKDSTGKEFNSHANSKGNDDYYDFVKSEIHSENKYDSENKHTSKSPQHFNLFKDEKRVNHDEINKYEDKNKQIDLIEQNNNENVDRQTSSRINVSNNEKYNKPNEKFKRQENSAKYEGEKSNEENFTKERKYSKAEYKHSGTNKHFKRNDQPKISENQRPVDKKSIRYEKSEKYEHTKSKNKYSRFRGDENSSDKLNQHKKNSKFETTLDYSDKVKFSENLNHEKKIFSDNYQNTKNVHTDQNKNPTSDESTNQKDEYVKKQEPNNFMKAAEKLAKYLKEKCDKNRQKTTDLYNKLKEGLKEKIKFPMELFNVMFNKYCYTNANSKKKDEYKKEQLKGEYERNNNGKTIYFSDELPTVTENSDIKNVDLKLTSTRGNSLPSGKNYNSFLELSDRLREWSFNYDSPSPNNESNIDGEWFIKAGESRTKARCHQRRSDWWFDRASHRRSVQSSPHNWFVGRRKNWFFRRAWAREQCRETSDSYWCHPPQEETVTIPGPSFS